MEERDSYPIYLNKRWSLEDFHQYSRKFEQVYYASEALFPQLRHASQERIDSAFRNFPWQGGFSVVNFYRRLRNATPVSQRPAIKRINYASPGAMELFLSLPVIIQVSLTVGSVAGALTACHKLYDSVHKGLSERKLLRIEADRKGLLLEREEMQFVLESSQKVADMLGIEEIEELHARTGDPVITIKVLLSYYRRIRDLAEYHDKGKASIPLPPPFD